MLEVFLVGQFNTSLQCHLVLSYRRLKRIKLYFIRYRYTVLREELDDKMQKASRTARLRTFAIRLNASYFITSWK